MKILSRILSFLLAFLLMALPCLAENPPAGPGRPLAPRANYARSISLRPRAQILYWSESNPGKFKLTVNTRPELSQLTEGVTWESNDENENVVKVDKVDENTVEVTATGIGRARIYARVRGRSRDLIVSCRVRVRGIPVRSISINPNHLDLDLSNELRSSSAQLTATVLPKNASCTRVTWSSSDESIATVDSITGLVKAQSKGNCTVTATDAITKKKKASIQVHCIDGDDLVPVVFTAGGDLVLGGDKKKRTDQHFANCIKGENGQPDYPYVLENLFPLLDKDDFSIFNLEGPLQGGRTPRKPWRRFNFYGKPDYVNILTEGSVEVVNVVNNHIHNYRTKPQTLRHLKKAHIKISDEQIMSSADNVMNFTKKTKRGNEKTVRVGFIGFFGPAGSSTIASKIKKAKGRCDMLVVSFHFCDAKERVHTVSGSQIRQARAAVDAGAAVVLGHHTHVPSGIEVYKGVYIYYGLGTTQSSGKNSGLRDMYNTFLARQTIWCDPDIGFTLCGVPTLYPICPTSAPLDETTEMPTTNNCQPIFLQKGDRRFDYVLDVINDYSRGNLKEDVDFVYKAHPQ
ncbi:MAG: CapA family protein [Candidatus Excrementavichristensenella sp.]|jgi:hypothetical protein